MKTTKLKNPLKEIKKIEKVIGEKYPNSLLIKGNDSDILELLNYTHKRKIDLLYFYPAGKIEKIEKKLRLARKLLKETGAIIVSANKDDMPALELLMNKVFGINNAIITDACYAKNRKLFNENQTKEKTVLTLYPKLAEINTWKDGEKSLKENLKCFEIKPFNELTGKDRKNFIKQAREKLK